MNKRIKKFLFNTFTRKLMNFKGAYGRNGGEGVERFIHLLIINLGNVDNLKFIFLNHISLSMCSSSLTH